MKSFEAYSIAVLAIIISTHNMIVAVNGQCTVERCETGETSISIATEIQQTLDEFQERLQAIDQRSQEQDIYIKQVQSVHEFLNVSFNQMNYLNASLQQLKYQQDIMMTSLQAVDRRSQEQDIYMKQVQSIRELINASQQESETQQKSQHDIVLKRFETIDRRLSGHDITIKNETQNLWKFAIAVGIDFVLPIIINDWIVFMHRFDGSLNFNRTWIEYRNGFGDIGRGEFWLGNEKIHRLTNRSGVVYTLRIEVQLRANGAWYYADYSAFSLDSESNKYTLRLSGFSGGNAGDSFLTLASSTLNLGGMNFSTWDKDNDRYGGNCASLFGGGWWYNDCHLACFTCQYNGSFFWYSLRHVSSDTYGYLRAARMMIRSK